MCCDLFGIVVFLRTLPGMSSFAGEGLNPALRAGIPYGIYEPLLRLFLGSGIADDGDQFDPAAGGR